MDIVPENKDNDLLAQIDEFRQRAEQLEGQLQAREAKAAELEDIVSQKNEKANELDRLIEERNKQADYLTEVVRNELGAVSGQFTVQISELKDALNAALEESKSNQAKSLEVLSGEVSEKLENLENLTDAIPEKIHTESVQSYRNTQELIRELDTHIEAVGEETKKAGKKAGVSVPVLIFVILNVILVVFAFLFLSGILTFPFA